jgi:uncharacterized membrane protein YdjX (TVP38/TMEM64 family)
MNRNPTPPADPERLRALERSAGDSMGRSARKFLALVLAVALCLIVLHATPAGRALRSLQGLKDAVQAAGIWGPAVFAGLAALLSAVGCPRLALCLAAGLMFGFARGLALATGATLAGSYLTFLFARWSGRDWVSARLRRFPRMRALMGRQSVFTVFLARQLPITNIVINLLLSLTSVGHGVFLVGSLLGFLPTGAVATLSGSSLGKQDPAASALQLTAALGLLAVGLAAIWRLRRAGDKRGSRESG